MTNKACMKDKELYDIGLRGKPHIRIQQLDARGKVVWSNCYLGASLPFKITNAVLVQAIEDIRRKKYYLKRFGKHKNLSILMHEINEKNILAPKISFCENDFTRKAVVVGKLKNL